MKTFRDWLVLVLLVVIVVLLARQAPNTAPSQRFVPHPTVGSWAFDTKTGQICIAIPEPVSDNPFDELWQQYRLSGMPYCRKLEANPR